MLGCVVNPVAQPMMIIWVMGSVVMRVVMMTSSVVAMMSDRPVLGVVGSVI